MSGLTFAVAALAAALTGMGVGGGGIFGLWLSVTTNTLQQSVQGINLWFYLSAASASLTVHLKKRSINIEKTMYIAFCGTAGSLAGALLASHTEGKALRLCYALIMAAAGCITLYRAVKSKKHGGGKGRPRTD